MRSRGWFPTGACVSLLPVETERIPALDCANQVLAWLWTGLLALLAVGAATLMLNAVGLVQSCDDHSDGLLTTCQACGLKSDIFGLIDTTICPNPLIHKGLTVLVVIPRFLFVIAVLLFWISVPVLVANVIMAIRMLRSGQRSPIWGIQLGLIASLVPLVVTSVVTSLVLFWMA